jgi:hypothetical protein
VKSAIEIEAPGFKSTVATKYWGRGRFSADIANTTAKIPIPALSQAQFGILLRKTFAIAAPYVNHRQWQKDRERIFSYPQAKI